jgi:hypothetical protein
MPISIVRAAHVERRLMHLVTVSLIIEVNPLSYPPGRTAAAPKQPATGGAGSSAQRLPE